MLKCENKRKRSLDETIVLCLVKVHGTTDGSTWQSESGVQSSD